MNQQVLLASNLPVFCPWLSFTLVLQELVLYSRVKRIHFFFCPFVLRLLPGGCNLLKRFHRSLHADCRLSGNRTLVVV